MNVNISFMTCKSGGVLFSSYMCINFWTFYHAVSYPLLSIVGKFDGAVTRKSLNVDIEASYEKYTFESELVAKTGVKNPGDYEVEFDVSNLTIHAITATLYNAACISYAFDNISHHIHFYLQFLAHVLEIYVWEKYQKISYRWYVQP